MASSIGAGELAPFDAEGDGHGHEAESPEGGAEEVPGFVHPWAREMFKKGLSFNGNERNKLFLGQGEGRFLDLSDMLGADSQLDGRAVLASDFDDDGDSDLFVHNLQRGRHSLFRNEISRFEPAGSSLKLRLRATRSQYEAIGAVVEVELPGRRCAQVLSRGAGFASCQAPELIFGIGSARSAHIRVRWPAGVLEDFGQVEGPATLLLVEGSSQAEVLARRPAELADPLPPGLKLGLGAKVPELVLLDSEGVQRSFDPVALADGGRLYLAFWASYCRPCLEEIPGLQARQQEAGSKVLAVSVDVSGHHERAKQALARAGASYPLAFLAMDEEANSKGLDELVDLLRLPIPTTLVLGPDGRIEDVLRGPLDAR